MKTAVDFQELLLQHDAEAIVVFDGVCNFCNSTINFLVDKDRSRKLRYMPLQSALGNTIQEQLPEKLDSIICITASGLWTQSEAAIQIAAQLPYPYRLLRYFRVIPRKWRDDLYHAFSKRRYKWFGRAEQCRIPSEEERQLFI